LILFNFRCEVTAHDGVVVVVGALVAGAVAVSPLLEQAARSVAAKTRAVVVLRMAVVDPGAVARRARAARALRRARTIPR